MVRQRVTSPVTQAIAWTHNAYHSFRVTGHDAIVGQLCLGRQGRHNSEQLPRESISALVNGERAAKTRDSEQRVPHSFRLTQASNFGEMGQQRRVRIQSATYPDPEKPKENRPSLDMHWNCTWAGHSLQHLRPPMYRTRSLMRGKRPMRAHSPSNISLVIKSGHVRLCVSGCELSACPNPWMRLTSPGNCFAPKKKKMPRQHTPSETQEYRTEKKPRKIPAEGQPHQPRTSPVTRGKCVLNHVSKATGEGRRGFANSGKDTEFLAICVR